MRIRPNTGRSRLRGSQSSRARPRPQRLTPALAIPLLGLLPLLKLDVVERESSSLSTTKKEALRLANLFAAQLTANGIEARITKTWRDSMELLLGEASPADIEGVIRFATENHFWRSRVLSVPYLRNEFGRLRLQARDHGFLPESGSSSASWPEVEPKLRASLKAVRETVTGEPLSEHEIEGEVAYYRSQFATRRPR